MNGDGRIILVAGATGQQGGSVTRSLLADGWSIRALTRDPNKPRAQELARQGVELVTGNMDDRAAIDGALAGVYGVFSVQNTWLPEVGIEGEIRQGLNLADAAKAAGVRHVVYSSVGGAERNTGIPHFDSKWQIEQHIRELGLPATILRPVYFMENLNWSREQIAAGTLNSMGLRPDRKLQMIAVEDIGAIAARAFANPAEYIGKEIEIAGDELSENEIAATFSRVLGRPVAVARQPAEGGDGEMNAMVRWFDEQGYEANIAAVRAIHPGLNTLEAWARSTGWSSNGSAAVT